MACVSPLFQRCLCTYMRQQACTFCTCVTLRRAPEGLEKRKACQLKEVHHCGAGGCGRDRMCGAVRASPLLRSLLICQEACRLEWCIAAKKQEGNRQWNSTAPRTAPGGRETPWVICRLRSLLFCTHQRVERRFYL